MIKHMRIALPILVMIGLVGILPGCNDLPADEGVAPVWLDVHFNDSYVLSDVCSGYSGVSGQCNVFLDDTVNFVLSNENKSPEQETDGTLMDVIIRGSEVSYRRIDGGGEVPPSYVEYKTRRIEGDGGTFDGFNIIVRADLKAVPPLSYLHVYGFEPSTGFDRIICAGKLRFFGETVGGEPVETFGEIPIYFAEYTSVTN